MIFEYESRDKEKRWAVRMDAQEKQLVSRIRKQLEQDGIQGHRTQDRNTVVIILTILLRKSLNDLE